MRLATTAQMRALEQAAVDAGASWAALMEQAGWGVAQLAMRWLGPAKGKHVLVLAGPGNNGGDGLVVARHLHDAGARVTLYLWRRREAPDDANWARCRARDIPEHTAEADADQAELRQLLAQADLVIDALLGMGATRPVEGALATIIAMINSCATVRGAETPDLEMRGTRHATRNMSHRDTFAQSPNLSVAQSPDLPVAFPMRFVVLSIDMPTGVHSDSGAVLGSAVCADITVATGVTKRGLLHYPGRAYAGAIEVAEIGIAPNELEILMSETIDAARARGLLPARPAEAHKGTFGKVMVIAGSALYPGAASLATAAAARVGAGVVTLANGRGALAGPGRLPEVTLRPLPEADWNALGQAAADEALKYLAEFQALLVGPGLGREEPTGQFLGRLLGIDSPKHRSQIGFRVGAAPGKPAEHQRPELPPTVIDADGLTLLSQIEQWWDYLPRGRCVLTPHPGEMKRLLGTDALGDDYARVAEEAAKAWGQIVVLKGATTVVADPEGRSVVNDGGNAALATAGTGDVLAGVIAGLLAQGLAPFDAAALGVYLHSAAGRLVRDDLGDMGTIASDLLLRLPLAIKALKQS